MDMIPPSEDRCERHKDWLRDARLGKSVFSPDPSLGHSPCILGQPGQVLGSSLYATTVAFSIPAACGPFLPLPLCIRIASVARQLRTASRRLPDFQYGTLFTLDRYDRVLLVDSFRTRECGSVGWCCRRSASRDEPKDSRRKGSGVRDVAPVHACRPSPDNRLDRGLNPSLPWIIEPDAVPETSLEPTLTSENCHQPGVVQKYGD